MVRSGSFLRTTIHRSSRRTDQVNSRLLIAALRLHPAHRDYWQAETHPEEWLLVEWPKDEAELTRYWLSTLPPETERKDVVRIAKSR
jgi:SRSO17 transposase